MSNAPDKNPLAQLLAMILAGGTMQAEVHEIPPGVDADEFIADLQAKARAEHIKECPNCAAEAAAEEAAQAKERQASTDDEASDPDAAPAGHSRVGFMVFIKRAEKEYMPIPSSLRNTRAEAEANTAAFFEKGPGRILAMLGSTQQVEVRPVFTNIPD